MNVVRCHFFDNGIHDIYAASPIFLLNNLYAMDKPVRGSGNIIRCYPGACSKFNIGLFGYGCQPLANRRGNNCSLCRPGLYLPAETTYSSCLACLPVCSQALPSSASPARQARAQLCAPPILNPATGPFASPALQHALQPHSSAPLP